MMATYNVYPAVDQNFNFPPEVRRAMSRSTEFSSQIVNSVATVIADAAMVTEATRIAVTKELAYRDVPIVLTERAFASDRPMTDASTRALYRFENDLKDSSSYRNDLIMDGGEPLLNSASSRFGTYGRASGRFKSLTADSFTTEGEPLPDLTVEGWVRTRATTTQVMAGRGNAYWIGMSDDGTVRAAISKNVGGDGIFYTTTKINDGEWHHLALIVREGSGGSVYCDGVRISNNTSIVGYRIPPVGAGNSTFFAVGGMGSKNFPFIWDGDIDEVRLSDMTRSFDIGYGVRPDLPGGFVTYVGVNEPSDMLAGDVWRKVAV